MLMYELELYSLTAFVIAMQIQDELYNPEFTLTFLEKILTWSELQVL